MACTDGRIGDGWANIIDRRFIQEGEGLRDIPSIDQPDFTLASQVDFLPDTSIVLGIAHQGIIKAYPLDILHWHEVVNDIVGETRIAITYSTLSGSGVAFERVFQDAVTFELGVTGLLYNSNLIVIDDISETYWQQILGLGVKGIRIDQELKEFPLIEMNWATWRLLFPNSQVLNTKTGFNRPYQTYPYGDYRTNDTKLLFDLTVPLDSLDQPISFKEKGLGITIGANTKVYPMSAFPTTGLGIIEDEFSGESVVVIGSQEHQLLAAYSSTRVDGSEATFQIADSNPLWIVDDQGIEFDVFGKSVKQDEEAELQSLNTKIAYWFSWAVWQHPESVPLYQ